MGMGIDLIDRDMYQMDSRLATAGLMKNGLDLKHIEAQLAEMRLQMLDEKDKFILSEKNNIESPMKGQKNGGNIARTKLPASYRLIHREEKWGIDTNENKYERVAESNTGDEVITTTLQSSEKNAKRESAIS